ncbi:ComEA family DNA-binding protein [Patescibacteria group bacterium]|nr:ComEA family DNA-binding protein [Patescibacteria group bacterium]MBU0777249.1 ComEA family DNA-binding protein [Patescibacteria group bacterium]MBU0846200.1 ComEA family DNA-binding protein [Patescibacteria group bacterium]MBU0922972.1 ComEA family DNA-binding protein [Patescibacteria group bacterium]MBU1066178.1 ComEA family DNA-binding protein [Patescibacteria group bacterium]
MLPKPNLQEENGFNIDWEGILLKYRYQILLLLVGVILIGLGVFLFKNKDSLYSSSVEVLESSTDVEGNNSGEVVIEVSGAVETPGVYKLSVNARVEDALIAAGGISADADRDWMEKTLNRAAKILDGQKIYIPRVNEQINGSSANSVAGYQSVSSVGESSITKMVNVNTASQKELESLWGIGPVTAQNIIEQRPYSSVEELLNKKILKTNVYETNKDKLSIY